MPSFNPFSSVSGRSSVTLFDIRLENDFIVFRGNEHESSGQLLKGVIVLCLSAPLRMEDIRLRLTGTLRLNTPGVSGQKVDKSVAILDHRWSPFVGTHGKSMTLPAGNYEYPFEYMLPGDTAESVEGIPEASITYKLKSTIGRGKLAYDIHSYKHLRIIRTLEPGALEFLHAMSVENIWPNKVDYSIVIPQKAVVFGGFVTMEMRFTPLLKGLELGEVTAKLIEVRDCMLQGPAGITMREHRTEREVSVWRFDVTREEHWSDMIEDTGQDGWALTKQLNLPRKLRQCVQDLNHHGIKVRHKIKLTVALKNPDGHISELRATLPVSIFISPNMPLDEQGNLVSQNPGGGAQPSDSGAIAPPGYGEHILDQLYDEVDISGLQTPGIQSGVSSPFYAQSRSGSLENLSSLNAPFPPAALSSRLADVSIDPSQRNPPSPPTAPRSEPHSTALSRSNSGEDHSGRESPEAGVDMSEFADLSRVPSYQTAVRTPARSRATSGVAGLPDYNTALSAPSTPPATDSHIGLDILAPITEDTAGEHRSRSQPRYEPSRVHTTDSSDHRRLAILQARDQVY